MWIELCLLIVALVAGFYLNFKRKTRYFEGKGIPFVPVIFPWGNEETKRVFKGEMHFISTFDKYYQEYKNHPIVGVFSFTEPTVIINDIDLVKQVLLKCNFTN